MGRRMANQGADASARFVFGEGYVHHSEKAVFVRTIGSNLPIETGGIELMAADVVAPLGIRLALLPAVDGC